MRKILLLLSTILAILACETKLIDRVEEPPTFRPSTVNRVIDWNQFPAFNLPFTIVYGGPKAYGDQNIPLTKGFSHLDLASATDVQGLPFEKRAALWYLIAFPFATQPWEVSRSPWGNDKALYERHWNAGIQNQSLRANGTANGTPNVELFIFDIERQHKSNDSILGLKSNLFVPTNIKSLDNQSFIQQYKKELQSLYLEPINLFKAKGKNPKTRLSSYGDAPIFNIYSNITGNSWADWISKDERLNFLNQNLETNKLGGAFYDTQDVITPSIYFYHDYPNPLAPDYLGYLLFQVEVNRARTPKPIIPFVWMKFSGGLNATSASTRYIKPYMAEAAAIFPFMAGAKGLWLWEDPSTFNADVNLAAYEHFVNGLFRLSKFKSFFEGNPTFVAQENPRDLVNNRIPVWRGVVNGNKILVAASNPYADETAETTITIKYKSWKRKLVLKGREVYLGEHTM